MPEKPSSTSGHTLRCRVLTPEGTVCDQQTDFVAVWLEDGQMGIAVGRKPMIARLGIGPLRIGRAGSKAKYYYIEGGLVEVAENVVTVLTERAIPAEELNPGVVAERLKAAQRLPDTTPELQKRRQEALRIAQAQWRVLQAAGR
ncbi:MAG: ATP synthase F1 subunit epsilon [Thermoguttaceae bacterium]|nr:ATP synthase F1 subunit epsilon [Thermoguttaceae bacterium]MDW8039529.1 ATP synthase F1 subunit epsilon [Thermoguttaceae bacterium]